MGGLRHRSDPLLRALSTTVSQRLSRVHQSTNFRRPQFCRCSAGRLFLDSCRAKRTCLGPIARVITTASHSPHPTFTRSSPDPLPQLRHHDALGISLTALYTVLALCVFGACYICTRTDPSDPGVLRARAGDMSFTPTDQWCATTLLPHTSAITSPGLCALCRPNISGWLMGGRWVVAGGMKICRMMRVRVSDS